MNNTANQNLSSASVETTRAITRGDRPCELMRGVEVIIYQDPITQQKPEGLAKLSTFLKSDGNLEQWNVRFVHEREVYPRWIQKPTS